MIWAWRLKRVFQLDLTLCCCSGQLKFIASIEEPLVVRQILAQLEQARGPPVSMLV